MNARLCIAILSILALAFSSGGPGANLPAGQSRKSVLPVSQHASLASFIAEVKQRLPRSGAEGFIEPSDAERQVFQAAMATLLNGGLPVGDLASLNYEAALLRDEAAARSYWVVVEKQVNHRGLGTYIFDTRPRRNIVLEVPHPLFDLNTPEQGAQVLRQTSARALFISGTHRCSNAAVSPCTSAGSSACDEITRVSDVAHYTRNFFHAAHQATLKLRAPPVVVQLHGNSTESLPDVVLSDVSRQSLPETAPVNRLRAALKARSVSAGSCNFAADTGLSLCGGSNVQGRASNGVVDACTLSATASTGLFLHVEQHLNIRNNPLRLIEALNEVFPAQ